MVIYVMYNKKTSLAEGIYFFSVNFILTIFCVILVISLT